MLSKDISPFIRRAFVMERTPYNKLVKCVDSRLFYVLRGSGKLTVNGSLISFEKNHFFLWKSGTEYQWTFSKKEKPSLAIINFDYTQQYRNHTKMLRPVSYSSFNKKKIYETPDFVDAPLLNAPILLENKQIYQKAVLNIIDEFSSNRPFSHELAENLLSNLILRILQSLSSSATQTHSKIDPILDYIHQNYHKEITNSTLAEIANYHPHYINLLMKEYTGITLHSYLVRYRLEQSLNLIMNTDLSIETIAHKTGFKNQSHFCKIFKQTYGTIPSEYRKATKFI